MRGRLSSVTHITTGKPVRQGCRGIEIFDSLTVLSSKALFCLLRAAIVGPQQLQKSLSSDPSSHFLLSIFSLHSWSFTGGGPNKGNESCETCC